MAGHAAYDAEVTESTALLAEINERLRGVFGEQAVPSPSEVIVTRWRRDPFTRGTYSYVGPRTRSGDYDLMAQAVGNLHFAGEATCGTHPATVHGALLSGLRVAADVVDRMSGPISIPMPVVGPAPVKQESQARYVTVPASMPAVPNASALGVSSTKAHELNATEPTANAEQTTIKAEPDTISISLESVPAWSALQSIPIPKKLAGPPRQSVCAQDNSFWAVPTFDGSDLDYEANIVASILSQIGDKPTKPSRPGVNPFLLFTKAKWEECKIACSKDNNNSRDAIRATIGRWWKALSEEEKRPYLQQSEAAQKVADAQRREWAAKAEKWDVDARRIREEYVREHPPPMREGGGFAVVGAKRKSNNSSCVMLDHV